MLSISQYPIPMKKETSGRTDLYIASWLKSQPRDKVLFSYQMTYLCSWLEIFEILLYCLISREYPDDLCLYYLSIRWGIDLSTGFYVHIFRRLFWQQKYAAIQNDRLIYVTMQKFYGLMLWTLEKA